MAPSPEGWDDFEESTAAPLDETLAPADPWVTGDVLSEILYLELRLAEDPPRCPRCSHWVYVYGSLRFCSHDCPENLIAG